MILHRLHLTNFRGIADRQMKFPDHGVIVVCGPNEIGKSSILDALDLLIEAKDRSAKEKVKQVKPMGADVGAEIEAEISTGPYRFIYRKRFHKKPITELKISAPVHEQLDGDPAHDRVLTMLAETVDLGLWSAQRVLQAAATAAVDLSGCDALTRALDVAAGDDAAQAGGESVLIEAVEAEFGKYFTASSEKPTGEWKTMIGRLATAKAELDHCRAAVAEVDERVCRHEEHSATLQQLSAALKPAQQRRATAEQAAASLTEIEGELARARLAAAEATAASENSASAQARRHTLTSDGQRRAETLAGLQADLIVAVEQEGVAQQVAEAAAAASTAAATALTAAQQRKDTACAAEAACAARAAAERLTGRLARIDEVARSLAETTEELEGIVLTSEALSEIEKIAASVDLLHAQLAADSGTVAFTAVTELAIAVDGVPVTLAAGESWTPAASTPVTVEVPGVLTVQIDPGASAAQLRARFDAAQLSLGTALAAAGAADLAAARAVGERRATLTTMCERLTANLDGLRSGDDVEQLRARLVELTAATPDSTVDADAVAAEVLAATAALDQQRAVAAIAAEQAAGATAALAEATNRTVLLRDRMGTAETELGAVAAQLTTLRATATDEAVAARAAADADVRAGADALLAEWTARYDAANPAAIRSELAAAKESMEELVREHTEIEGRLNTLTIELGLIGGEGRYSKLDDAETQFEHTRTEHSRMSERAAAARLLRSTMIRHRHNTRLRYVAPYRAELERLGRTVFGETFAVEVDTDLTIVKRTKDGCTLPYEWLSGGAKEQLGILARLAGAALVAKEDTVPVIIDDALGFTDSDRLTKMAAVFNTVGTDGQVILLTCSPDRYAGIKAAEFIDLSP